MSSKKTIIIAGGGTGGHIYPGVAIARAIQRLEPDTEVHFAGARGGLEEKIIPRENLPLHLIDIGKLHSSVGLKTRLITLLKLPMSLVQAVCIVRRLKPVAVLGVGGFASGPVLFVASLMGYRTLIWEPNAHPGMANRMLSRFVRECLLVFEDAAKYLKAKNISRTGLPVRSSKRRPAGYLPAAAGARLKVLVFGGSQGARAINTVVAEAFKRGGEILEQVELVHQTGTADFAKVRDIYSEIANAYPLAGVKIECLEYLHDMDSRYAWADLVVCRAGASTVAEICAARKAAVFIPLPTAADNHQQRNAEVLERKSAGVMILQKDFTPESFSKLISDFHIHREKLANLEKNVAQFDFEHADDDIAAHLLRGDQ
jgi:UDP-N-acetylglucosamine--N-acetylmuramyl-(pentapeptide) pyrophosphoryl-undecaprenol N-acetylglucosamine transferase